MCENKTNYSVFDVANWFLKQEIEDLDHKKIQKLCYYAQAWHYALYGSPLFNGEFEAWVQGPVNRQLWDKLKSFGYIPIKSSIFDKSSSEICTEDNEFLGRIMATYGDFSGYELEQLTHQEEPWIKARNGISEMQICTNPIDTTLMRSYYSSLYSGDGCGE